MTSAGAADSSSRSFQFAPILKLNGLRRLIRGFQGAGQSIINDPGQWLLFDISRFKASKT
jgi:hypothetical protein